MGAVMRKVKITLVDIGFSPKEDKVIRKLYPIDDAVEAGTQLCQEFGYDTFKFEPQKSVKKTKK
jgi:hypothetical protein